MVEMVECREQAKLHSPESRDRRRQEADRGLELEAAQVMLMSVVHKGTGVLQVGSSSTVGCCTVGYMGKPTPNRDVYFAQYNCIYGRSKREAGSENEIKKTIPFTIA